MPHVGKFVRLKDGRTEKIVQTLANRTHFRVASEMMGPVIQEYSIDDIAMLDSAKVSLDEGKTWVTLSIKV